MNKDLMAVWDEGEDCDEDCERHTDIWNPIDNVTAAIGYITSRYGDPPRTWNANGKDF